jgi:hypothetical protein
VHHILVSGCLRQSTKHLKKPALCGLSCFWLFTSVPLYLPTVWIKNRTRGYRPIECSEIKRLPLSVTVLAWLEPRCVRS